MELKDKPRAPRLAALLLLAVAIGTGLIACGGEQQSGFNEDVARVIARRAESATQTAEAARWTPTPTVAPAMTATPDPNAAVLEVASWKAVASERDAAATRIVGVVGNIGASYASTVQVSVELLDAAGAVIASGTTPPSGVTPDIAPGARSPFAIELRDLAPASIASARFQSTFTSQPAASNDWRTPGVVVDRWDQELVQVTVSNASAEMLRYPRILVAGYDASGNIINVYTIKGTAEFMLPTGFSQPFDGVPLAEQPIPASIEVHAWANVCESVLDCN